jgi:molybdate transport system regulatory protein
MSKSPTDWPGDWSLHVRLWIERAGHAILGKGRVELLEGIDRWHSISAAARQMDMSYRRAWLLVQAINQAAGEPLVEAAVGGTRGGGARLTPRGREVVALFRDLQRQSTADAGAALARRVGKRDAAALHVAAAVSLQVVLGQLLADYALRQPGVRVRAVFGGSDELAEQCLAGARADLFLSADAEVPRRLARAGLIDSKSVVPLADNSLAIITAADRELTLRKPADLLRASIDRVAIADASCPLGRYTRAWLESLKLADRFDGRALAVADSRAVVSAVTAGRAAAGLVYSSDAITARDCRILFRARRLPSEIRYFGAAASGGPQAAAARALLDYLTSSTAAARFRRCGFLPVDR